jgi:hypothetical protein
VFSRFSNFRYSDRIATAPSLLFIAFAVAGCASLASHSSPSGPVISLSATSFNFSTVLIGQSSRQTLHVSNTGTAPLTLDSVALKSSQFALTGPSVPRTILPAQKIDYALSFEPNLAGSASASVEITSNARNTPASVSLAGVAEKAFAAVGVSPSSISFGNLKLESTLAQSVTLKNTGDINIAISGITVVGSGFGYSSLSPGYSLAPNQSVTFQIWFRPQASGSASGNVSILSRNLATPAIISVSGEGVASSPGSLNPGSPAPSPHSVALSWGPGAGPVAGYRVYRDDGSGYSPLSAIIPDLAYRDSTVVSGSIYRYVVTAVDASGDESVYSNEATAVIPTP